MSHREYPLCPQPAVGGIVFRDKALLLVQRKNPPSRGKWAIPGGRIKLGETIYEAVAREIWEETGIRIEPSKPVHTFDAIERDATGRIRFHYVIIDIEATYVSGELCAGDDAVAAKWVDVNEIGKFNLNAATRKLLKDRYGIVGKK